MRVDLITGLLPRSARASLRVVTLTLAVAFLAVVIWVTTQSALTAFRYGRVSAVMLGEAIPTSLPLRLVIAVDAFGFADPDTAEALQPLVRKLSTLMKDVREDLLAAFGDPVFGSNYAQRREAGGRRALALVRPATSG